MSDNNGVELDEIKKEEELKEVSNIDNQRQLNKLSETNGTSRITVLKNDDLNISTIPKTRTTTLNRSETQIKNMPKIKKKVGIMVCTGLLCIIFGITAGIFWPSYFKSILIKEIVLSPKSTSFEMWKETPVPMYLKIYLYNWTNHDETGKKPHFIQMGPYVFREIDYKVNNIWNENNGTVTFQQKRVWNFVTSMSNGSLADKVTNLNPIAATIAYSVRNKNTFIKTFVSKALQKLEKIVITKSVQELLFDGYDDILLKVAVDLNVTKLPFEKFAWFYGRNGSESYDGTFNMLTGLNNMYDIGIIKAWKYNDISPYYSKTCGKLQGTNGDLWPPLLNNKTVSVFSPDVCTTLSLKADGKTEWLGLTGSKFISDEDMFDNGTNVKSRKCYCEGVECQPSGSLNISLCKYGAPAFVSLPHFYLADESYKHNISGMNPSKKDHEFVLVVQPDTGIPMQVRAALQINFLVQPDQGLSYFKDMPKMYVPMIWFTQEVNLTTEYASEVNLLLLLPSLGNGILFSIASIGILLIFISIFIYLRQGLKDDQNENLLPKEVAGSVNNEG